MDNISIDIKVGDTCDCIHKIKQEGTSVAIDNVKNEQNTCKIGDIIQKGKTSYSDNIKEEEYPLTMDTNGRNFTCDTIDIKVGDTCDCIDNIKEEGTCVAIDNVKKEQNPCEIGDLIQKGKTFYLDNIKEEEYPPTMDTNGRNFTCDTIDIKVGDTCDCIDNIKEEGTSVANDNVSCTVSHEGTTYYSEKIKEEGASPTKDNIGKSFICDCNDIKEEDRNVYIDDIKVEGISSNRKDIQQQDHDEAKLGQSTQVTHLSYNFRQTL